MQTNRSILAAYLEAQATTPNTLPLNSNDGAAIDLVRDRVSSHVGASLTSTHDANFRSPTTSSDQSMAAAQSRNEMPTSPLSSLASSLLMNSRQSSNLQDIRQRRDEMLQRYHVQQIQIENQQRLQIAARLVNSLEGSSRFNQLSSTAFDFDANNDILLELLSRQRQQERQALELNQLRDLQTSLALYPMIEPAASSMTPRATNSIAHQGQFTPQNLINTSPLDRSPAKVDSRSSMGNVAHLGSASMTQAANVSDAVLQAYNSLRLQSLQSMLPSTVDSYSMSVLLEHKRQLEAATLLPDSTELISEKNRAPKIMNAASEPILDAPVKQIPANSNEKNDTRKPARRKGRVGKFPQKLHRLLNDLMQRGRTDIASFLPHGRAFAIHNSSEFAKEVMPQYFRMSRFSSFQRQLNLYDFQRIAEGPNKGSYYHEFFVQGQPDISNYMKRNKIKGNMRCTTSAEQPRNSNTGMIQSESLLSPLKPASGTIANNESDDDTDSDDESN